MDSIDKWHEWKGWVKGGRWKGGGQMKEGGGCPEDGVPGMRTPKKVEKSGLGKSGWKRSEETQKNGSVFQTYIPDVKLIFIALIFIFIYTVPTYIYIYLYLYLHLFRMSNLYSGDLE